MGLDRAMFQSVPRSYLERTGDLNEWKLVVASTRSQIQKRKGVRPRHHLSGSDQTADRFALQETGFQ